MEFFEKLTKKATETYKGAAEKTGKLAKETKLRLKINENKSKIKELYEEIGKKVYEKHSSVEEVCIKKDLEGECAKIDILANEIEVYNREILDLSNQKECIDCKEKLQKDAKFCTKCGAKQPEEDNIEKRQEELEVLEAEIVDNLNDITDEQKEEIKENFEEEAKRDIEDLQDKDNDNN